MSVLSTLFPQAGLVAALGAAALIAGGAGYAVHKFDDARYADLVAADAKQTATAIALAAATQKNLDGITIADAQKEAAAQAALAAKAASLAQKVHVYVTPAQDRVGCVSYGLIRLHDAAVLGVDPGTLQLPAGVTDDTCSAVAPSALGSAIVGNYAAAKANAEELTALQADVAAKAPKPAASAR